VTSIRTITNIFTGILLLSQLVFANDDQIISDLREWYSLHWAQTDSQAVKVSFNYAWKNDYDSGEYPSKLLIFDEKFRLEMGPKTIVTDGEHWQTYDSRSNQLFWHDPDTTLKGIILQYTQPRLFDHIILEEAESPHTIQANFPASTTPVIIRMSDDHRSIQELIFHEPTMEHRISSIQISSTLPSDALQTQFYLKVENAFEFDLRTGK